ncbi:MAG TPA: helix-turn-helix transcriptional regulator [Terriglobales bacterium]|nr:helix-turn-helix transcriptional regulator [Terriglobales bacterium]
MIKNQLAQKKWSVAKFASEINRTAEHARKLQNGTAFPSADLAERIAVKLGIDPREFQKQLIADRWLRKHGQKPPQPEHSSMGPLQEIWHDLTPEQQECVLCVANCLMTKRISARIQ